ncbi:calcium-transporting ATPase 3 [Arthroderma uncinatum]|uniref:calcium-transporting ATPase 3 n=1 Tax=Arthroderma uncinatum TaxID=74035 RepID=UPI00144AE0F1|nr:calcium-transporting ATPase 3 [Arthroderma uncinatum]KAF3481383.1 calcium-transporting ATPase 3 [Arthroderma uncinatum]
MGETRLSNQASRQSQWPLSRPAHGLQYETVIEEIRSDPKNGLTASEAQYRLEQYGRNDLGNIDSGHPAKILLRQIANAMTLILMMAMAVSFGIKAWIEGGVLAAVILLNIGIGFVQEFQAEKTMDSLRSLSSPTACSIRDGTQITIPTAEIVPGDIVEMKTGDTVPADIRLIEAINFETDEALLTGESVPVRKEANAVFDDDTGPGDRLNICYSSSIVTKGRARGIVVSTGVYTEIGSIAAAFREKGAYRRVKRKPDGSAGPHRYLEWGILTISDALGDILGLNVGTPLQRKLSKLALVLLGTAVICAIVVLAANKFSNHQEVIVYAVATGLIGTKRMVKRHVIVRNLNSLEALGAITDICSDKTGTLTQGKMVAHKAWVPAKGTYSVGESSQPFNPTLGKLYFEARQPCEIDFKDEEGGLGAEYSQPNSDHHLDEFLKVASLANLAVVHETSDGDWEARGDPTEIAIQVFASRFNWNRSRLATGDNPAWKQIAEFPFDSDIKKMSVIFESASGGMYAFTKGAVERVIGSCSLIQMKDGSEPEAIAPDVRDKILANLEAFAAQGLRVLALASKPVAEFDQNSGELDRNNIEQDLTFRGLIGLYDPPRPESAPSVRRCHEAGISVHMLTGDHPSTARAIATDVGILPAHMDGLSKNTTDSMVMTAHQFDKLTDSQIDALPALPLVVARCAPNTKVRMIEAMHRRRRFAAMTGDGVNDSPSLKNADVGIAMGMAGSDVAKDASDIILTDDNFASILNAIEEGRRIFDNIQKFILHVLSQNFAQAIVLLVGLVFKDKNNLSVFPLSPVEIIWLVMITSGLPDMGLGFEQATADIMQRPPQRGGIFTTEVMVDMLVYGTWVAALCLGAFTLVIYGFGDGSLGTNCNKMYEGCELVFRARATTFACLTWFVLFLAWEMVDMRRSFFNMRPASPPSPIIPRWCRDIWKNQFLFWANMSGFTIVFPLIYIPVINRKVFRHTGISWEWVIVLVGTILFFAGAETWKWIKRAYFRRKASSVSGGVGGKFDLENRKGRRGTGQYGTWSVQGSGTKSFN